MPVRLKKSLTIPLPLAYNLPSSESAQPNPIMNKTKSLFAAVALAAAAVSAQAAVFNTISGSFSASSLPTGINGTVFYVSSPVDVTALGFADSGAAGLGGSADVGIYSYIGTPNSGSINGTAVVSTTISGSGTATTGNYVWQSVASTQLTPGYYALLATSVSLVGDFVGDTTVNAADGLPTFTGAPVATGAVNSIFVSDITGGSFGIPVHSGGHRYKLVNFEFTPVPEPETYAMIAGVGLVAFGLWRRRQ